MDRRLSMYILTAALMLSVSGTAWATLTNKDTKMLETGKAKAIEQAIKEKKLDPNDRNKNGDTALMFAVNNPNQGIVTALVNHGADTEEKCYRDSMTALIWAANKNKSFKAIKELVDVGADVNAVDNDGVTALMYALRNNKDPKVAQLLINSGADVKAKDNKKNSVIHYLLLEEKSPNKNNVQLAKALLERGAAEDIAEGHKSPLIMSLDADASAEVVREIIKASPESIDCKEGMDKRSAIMTAAWENLPAATIKELIRGGADVNLPDSDGFTPLMLSIKSPMRKDNKAEVVRTLLDAGADETLKLKSERSNTLTEDAVAFAEKYDKFKSNKAYKVFKDRIAETLSPENSDLCKTGTAEKVKAALAAKTLTATAKDSGRNTALMLAAAYNPDPEVTSLLIKDTLNINRRNKDGATALMLAAENGAPAGVIEKLIAAGAKVNLERKRPDGDKSEKDGWTAIQHIVVKPNAETISALVKAGAKIDERYPDSSTVLLRTVRANPDVETLTALIEAGADISASDAKGKTALMYALDGESTTTVDFLLENGADINLADRDGNTVLMTAIANGKDVSMVIKLLDHDADPNRLYANGDTALIAAIKNGADMQVVSSLLSHGASIDAGDSSGKTALMHALETENANGMFELLVASGADVNARSNDGNTALNLVLSGQSDDAKIKLLLDNGVDVNAPINSIGETALMAAIADGKSPSTIKLLLEANANPNEKDRSGIPLLTLALSKNTNETAKLLIEHGADVNATDNFGYTALMEAVEDGVDAQMITLLLDKGADVNAQDKNGITSLMYALDAETPLPVMELLVKAGADVNAHKNGGATVLSMAISKKADEAVIKLLKDNGAKDVETPAVAEFPQDAVSKVEVQGVPEAFPNSTSETTLVDSQKLHEVATGTITLNKYTSMLTKEDQNPFNLVNDPDSISDFEKFSLILGENSINGARDSETFVADMTVDNIKMLLTYNYREIGKALASGVLKPNMRDMHGNSAAMWATANPDPEVLNVLIENDANIHVTNSLGMNPLMVAAYNRTGAADKMVRILLKAEADVNARDFRNRTALDWLAIRGNSVDALNTLISAGADVNAVSKESDIETQFRKKLTSRSLSDLTPADALADMFATDTERAYQASKRAHIQEDRLDQERPACISAGIYINKEPSIRTLMNDTVTRLKRFSRLKSFNLIYTAWPPTTTSVELFSLFNKFGVNDKTPLLWALEYNCNPDIVRALINKGADVKAQDASKASALMLAIRGGYPSDIINLLIDKGANVKARDSFGRTPLMYASRFTDANAIQLLIDKGVNVKARSLNGYTALMYAAMNSTPDILTTLVKNGADIQEECNEFGETALMAAAGLGFEDTIKTLLEMNADAKIRTFDNWSAFDYCKHNPRNKVSDETLYELQDASYE